MSTEVVNTLVVPRETRLRSLLDWLSRMAITYQRVTVSCIPETYGGESLGVLATDDIEEGALIATIPKAAIISVKTTSLAEFLEEHKIAAVLGKLRRSLAYLRHRRFCYEGGLGLVFAVMHEVAQGVESKWYAYLSSLPEQENIPMFWGGNEERLLKGTDAEFKSEEHRTDTAADYEAEIAPLLDLGAQYFDKAKMSLQNFRRAASWVGSRAFGVDDYHGMGLVPFADIFNHKASIINPTGEYQLEGACLEAESCDEQDDDGVPGDEWEEDKDISVVNGTVAISDPSESEESSARSDGEEEEEADCSRGAAVTRGSMLDPAAFPDQDLRPHICIVGAERDGQQVLEGQEIFNTFGELENSELVCKYGFALPNNPFNAVHLDKKVVVEEAAALISSAEVKTRCLYLEEQSNLLDELIEPFLVLPRAEIGPSLLVAARILSCSASEFLLIEHLNLSDALQILRSRKASSDKAELAHPSKKQKRSNSVEDGPCPSIQHGTIILEQDCGISVNSLIEESEASIELCNTRISSSSAWFTEIMLKLLQRCLQRRLSAYLNRDIQIDRNSLEAVELENPRSERQCSITAAYTLVISEKELINDALQAINTSLGKEPEAS